MKNCPVCEKIYSDEVSTCETDGVLLKNDQHAADPYIGHVIRGGYRVMSKLAEGAMGTLYVAEQVAIEKMVVLKILNRRYCEDEQFIQRFRREAGLTVELSHPNIVTLLEFYQLDDGELVIAMDFDDGKTLSELIGQQGALDIYKAVQLGIQLADGLSAAHGAGLIHRDIKPDNLMTTGDGEALKIMDFGIARNVTMVTATRLTRFDVNMGTPEYMSPEQVNGYEATEQSDIYACGVVLYEMLTGKLPCKAPMPGATLLKQVSEVPTAVRQLRHEVPVAVERVVMRALEKDPVKRQSSAAQLADELRKAAASIDQISIAKTITAAQMIAAGEGKRRPLAGELGNAAVSLDIEPVADTFMATRVIAAGENRRRLLADELRKTAASIGNESVAKTFMATKGTAVGKAKRRPLSWKPTTGAAFAALGIVGYMLLSDNTPRVASTPVVLPSQEAPESTPETKPSAPVEDQSSARMVEPGPAELPAKQISQPDEVRANAATDTKPSKSIELAAAAKKPPEPTSEADKLRRIKNALQKRLQERLEKTPAPLAPPQPASSPLVPPAPTPAPPAPPQPASSPLVPPAAKPTPLPPQPAMNAAELAKIRSLVEQKLRNQGLLKVSESDRWGVSVDATGLGVVTLKGLIRDQNLSNEAVRLTREVPGVSEVRVNVRLPDGAENRQ